MNAPDQRPSEACSERQAALRIGVKRLRPEAHLPQRAYANDAAWDLFSADELTLPAHGRAVVGTGIALDLPTGLAAFTLPRSGLAADHGISLVNAPGLIDPGYRGEVKLILLNTDPAASFTVRQGDRLAQLLVVSLVPCSLCEVTRLSPSDRGPRGLGSSGHRA